MHVESADLCSFGCGIEQTAVALGAIVASAQAGVSTAKGSTAAPTSTSNQASTGYERGFGIFIEGFHDKIGSVGDELGIETEISLERLIDLGWRVVIRLELAHGAVDERVETRD